MTIIRDCSTIPQTEPCPSCAFKTFGCDYDNSHGPHVPFKVVFGATCNELQEGGDPFSRRRLVRKFARESIDGPDCAIDFDAHAVRIIPVPCPDLTHCVGCCDEAFETVTMLDGSCGTFERPFWGNNAQRGSCRDSLCWACLGECDIEETKRILDAANQTGAGIGRFLFYDLDTVECQVSSGRRTASVEYDLFVVGGIRKPDGTICGTSARVKSSFVTTCNSSCLFCNTEEDTFETPNKCVEWLDRARCGETGVCCTGRFGEEGCQETGDPQSCRDGGGTFIVGGGCASNCGGSSENNRCNCRTKCGTEINDCGRCTHVSIEFGLVPGGVEILQRKCRTGMCNPSITNIPACKKAVFYMVDHNQGASFPGAIPPPATAAVRYGGQYSFGPATIVKTEHDHQFGDLRIGGSLAYGLPVINRETGYGYVQFDGFNRFVPNVNGDLVLGQQSVGCEAYCADPAIIPLDDVPSGGKFGYGNFVGEYVPYC